jgi:hypothetical protein
MGGTRYSRDTWQKQQLRSSMDSTPKYGNKACSLCDRARKPEDLSLHVSKYKTCGDIHLALTLLSPDSKSCENGQENYREFCCPQQSTELPIIKSTGAVLVGLLLFWMFTKGVRSSTRRARNDDNDDDDRPIKNSSRHGASSNYNQMGDDTFQKKAKKSKKPIKTKAAKESSYRAPLSSKPKKKPKKAEERLHLFEDETVNNTVRAVITQVV